MAHVIHVDRKNFRPVDLMPAVEAIQAGKIVAFPTETVYGVGVSYSDRDALGRLSQLKDRDADKPFTVHCADTDSARVLVGHLSPPAQKLSARYWPGPLTIVFPRLGQQGLGVRVVGDTVGQQLIRMANVPLAATSANFKGGRPATSGVEVRTLLADRVDVIVDAGPAQLGEASSVVAVAEHAVKILREGVVASARILQLVRERICFVCTGNICRSPMAAAMLQQLIEDDARHALKPPYELTLEICSAGVSALVGEPASPEAIDVLGDYQARDIGREHRAQSLSAQLLEKMDRVLVMTREHQRIVRGWDRRLAEKVELLDPDGKDVKDPYGASLDTYRRCAAHIAACLNHHFFRTP